MGEIGGIERDGDALDRLFERFAGGSDVLQLAFAGGREPVRANAVPVDLGVRSRKPPALPRADASQTAVLALHVLEYIADYRGAIADWFRVLRTGGHLTVSVPHQFLDERKLYPPSRWEPERRRFYTAASLLAEIEEALDPMSYRVRLLRENDAGFDYRVPPGQPSVGCGEVVAVIERIERPDYADRVIDEPILRADESHFMRVVAPATREPVIAIGPAAGIARVLALKLDHRGDFIMARRGFETLRAQFPAAHITLVCGPWNRADAETLGLFDRVIGFDFFPEGAGHVLRAFTADESAARFATLLAGEAFDLAVDLRVHEETRALLAAVDARYRAGFGTTERFPFLDIALPLLDQTTESRAYRRLLKTERFGTRAGRHEGFAITNASRLRRRPVGDIVVFGPYERFEAGYWEIDVIVEPTRGAFEFGYDVAINSGTEILGFGTFQVNAGRYPRVALSLETAVEELEFRIKVGPSGVVPPFRFFGCVATRRGTLSALHQEEMQAMLAYLVGLRLRHPARLRELAA